MQILAKIIIAVFVCGLFIYFAIRHMVGEPVDTTQPEAIPVEQSSE